MMALQQPAPDINLLPDVWLDYLKLLLILGAIIVLAWVTLRYWLPRTVGLRRLSGGPIQVLARYPLEPRKTLYIIKAGADYLVIGAAENSIQTLASLRPESIEPSLAPPPDAPPESGFRRLLSRIGLRPV